MFWDMEIINDLYKISFWEKDGLYHLAVACPDPSDEGLITGGYRWTDIADSGEFGVFLLGKRAGLIPEDAEF